jgi:hypothetical protein
VPVKNRYRSPCTNVIAGRLVEPDWLYDGQGVARVGGGLVFMSQQAADGL